MLGNYVDDLKIILKAMERKVKSSDDIFNIEDDIWELSMLIDKLKELHEQINELVYWEDCFDKKNNTRYGQ